MKLVDYTGKLNHHKDYLDILKHLENKCKYIEYALVDEDDTKFVEKFSDSVLSVKSAKKWWGTKSSGSCKLYRLRNSSECFRYLKQFETFCILRRTAEGGDIAESTNFGINDIAFFDDCEIPLLFTTTHEGIIMLRNDLFPK